MATKFRNFLLLCLCLVLHNNNYFLPTNCSYYTTSTKMSASNVTSQVQGALLRGMPRAGIGLRNWYESKIS